MANSTQENEGKISLVGAGPGDPELLTLKALRVINSADLIFFDQLVSDEIRAMFPKGVPAFFVGKRKNHHSYTQEQINRLIVTKASQGMHVVRIKGGDPFVFGRGGEEMLEAARAGLIVDVVPGITAASGCTTSAEIPLTHRGMSQACTFITAHSEKDLAIDWQALARFSHSLVIYMGVSRASFVKNTLISSGKNGATPVAIIENGCRANQRDFTGRLDQLEVLIEQNNVQSPAIIVVGDVVNFKSQLNNVRQQVNNEWNADQEVEVTLEGLMSSSCA